MSIQQPETEKVRKIDRLALIKFEREEKKRANYVSLTNRVTSPSLTTIDMGRGEHQMVSSSNKWRKSINVCLEWYLKWYKSFQISESKHWNLDYLWSGGCLAVCVRRLYCTMSSTAIEIINKLK
jgi:hypothetical protein